MSAPSTTPSTTFTEKTSWYGGRKCKAYVQRVVCYAGAQMAAIGGTLPAFANVIAVHLQNTTAATVTGSAGGAADGIILAMFPTSAATVAATSVLTAPPTTNIISCTAVTNGATSGVILASIGIGTTESNGVYRGDIMSKRVFNATTPRAEGDNRRQTPAFLALLPGLASNGIFAYNSTAATSGAVFGADATVTTPTTNVAATVDVVMYVESFDDYPT